MVILFAGGGGQLARSRGRSSLRATQRMSATLCVPSPPSLPPPLPPCPAALPPWPLSFPLSTRVFGIIRCRPVKGVKVAFNKTNIT